MTKRVLLLTTFALSFIAVIVGMVKPGGPPAGNVAPSETRPVLAEVSADQAVSSIEGRGPRSGKEEPQTMDHPEEEIFARVPSSAPSASLRFTPAPATRFFTAAPARAGSGSHIRVLPASLASGTTTPSGGGPVVPAAASGSAPGTIALEIDASLHDPAVWMEEEQPISEVQESLKDRIADQFDAEVAAAITEPVAAKRKNLDQAWRDARARANQEYQKLFGGEAANRAGLNAGRTALAPP